MENHTVVSPAEWLIARKEHLAKEKEFTRLRDQLSRQRRELPWVRIEKTYRFDTPQGSAALADLFADRDQLIVYHFMFGPDWEQGCPSCSFWADNFNGIVTHLRHRNIKMMAVSRAPLAKLETYKKRLGWSFEWASSLDSDFNQDFHVSFTPKEMQQGEMYYNYHRTKFPAEEAPGVSVFYKNPQHEVFHTYSCYSRGLDMLNGAYHHMDLVPNGRDEDHLAHSMAWVRRRDQYEE